MCLKRRLCKKGYQISKEKDGFVILKDDDHFYIWTMRMDSHRQLFIRRGKWMWFKHIIRYGEIEGDVDNTKFLKFKQLKRPEAKLLIIKGKDVPIFIQTEGVHKRFLLPEDTINGIHIMNENALIDFLDHYPGEESGTNYQF